ncbi:hypothetical protein L207DRAFT_589832 [Hyaloscypha variabilis F]|uniref:Uncharacterized protein n=1 Tax=Hyaloscypha variabilis (strain UAMH 11265 / GT02V1 / F) TaxID=1149755 RepID=A0A2J6R4L8_HYAVF|nr:hypothetical protein L207DRAFT_589832 [Hyaloscypha variabilis F]
MATDGGQSVICVPMKLDAFVMNKTVCNPPPGSTVAPITQPNYTFLRLGHSTTSQEFLIQPDLMDHVDLHAAGDVNTNPRLTNLGTGELIDRRLGVYLSWIIPRFYRQGAANAQDTTQPGVADAEQTRRKQEGTFNTNYGGGTATNPADLTAPTFRSTPNRWLVIRRLHLDTVKPPSVVQDGLLQEFQGWILESDRLVDFDNLGPTDDIEVDMAPFVQGSSDDLNSQAEIFIGVQFDAVGWTEAGNVPGITRIPVSVLNSSNQLFADFTMHNSNVYSILDRFEGKDKVRHVTDATASYYVLGWHSTDTLADDVFNIQISNTTDPSNPTRGTRFDGCNMVFPDDTFASPKDLSTWRGLSTSASTLCHAAMYGVNFSTTALPPHSGASDAAALLANSVTIGTTPLDTILAFVSGHISDPTFASSKPYFIDLQKLQPMLMTQEEDVDSQLEAADMLSDLNFAPSSDTDSQWNIAGTSTDGTPLTPTTAQLSTLTQLNNLQGLYDQGNRDLRQLRWNLWSRWWKYFSASQDATKDPDVLKEVTAMKTDINNLFNQLQTWKTQISSLAASFGTTVEKGAGNRFYSLKDPTMLVSGITSPWPSDYQDKLRVRLPLQTISYSTSPSNPYKGWTGYESWVSDSKTGIINVMPSLDLQDAAKNLLLEFFMLHPPDDSSDKYQPPTTGSLPLYHDLDPGAAPNSPQNMRDSWNDTQPWFPLFLEWECEYTHIPSADWAFERVAVPNATPKYRYGIRANHNVSTETITDQVTVSGRVLILPQPSFSLATQVQALWQTLSPDEQSAIAATFDPGTSPNPTDPPSTKINDLLLAIQKLPFMSSPMTGLTKNLVTQLVGTHLKPLRRIPGLSLQPISTAEWGNAGWTADVLPLMDVETNTVPYAWHVDFPADAPSTFSPLKPVAHGQLRFTQLNVIDKFGQAISAIDPRYGKAQPLRLNVSEFYSPQLVGNAMSGPWNTIVSDSNPLPQYIQIPPNINQDARLNACLLMRDPPTTALPNPPWRQALEWESPLWGWLVVNYVERAIQLFLPNGDFYREVRLGGVGNKTTEPKWKPFDPPTGLTPNNDPTLILPMKQLDSLLQKLGPQTSGMNDYLTGFINMINDAMSSLPYAPNEYADYLSAIIGKPLALVNTGWSLELAAPPLVNQSLSCTNDPNPAVTDYNFPLWIGDRDRVYDGLVGFFTGSTNPPGTPGVGPTPGSELNLDTVYTFFPKGGGASDLAASGPVVTVKPYHISTTPTMDPTALRQQHDAQFNIVSAIMDPFTALHGYSGILPIKPVTIPPWIVQSALKSIAAFFTVGPIIVPAAVVTSGYSDAKKLTPEMDTAAVQALVAAGAVPAGQGIPIPVPPATDWIWLQPFDVGVTDSGGTTTQETLYNAIGVEPTDAYPKFEPPPYLAVEGYLQLRLAAASDAPAPSST